MMRARMPGTTYSQLPIYAAAFLAGVYILLSMHSLDAAWTFFAALTVLYGVLHVLKKNVFLY